MSFNRRILLLLAITLAASACKQGARPAVVQAQNPPPAAAATPAPAVARSADPQVEDAVERRGPFSIASNTYTVLLHYKRLRGKTDPDSQTLSLIEIVDAAGEVQYREPFTVTLEGGDFSETCSADIQLLSGSDGQGFLIDEGCLPSEPLSGGPWEILGLRNGKLQIIGKPLVTEGELGNFIPGPINRLGTATQILPDTLEIRVWTGYFFANVPVRVDWFQGKLSLAQHCFYQTGHGMAEGGCEMPVSDVQRTPSDQDLTFVRLFSESNEQIGPPTHVVVKKDARVEFLAAKVLTTWSEDNDSISLGVGDDIWVKVRIDGKEGWLHTTEDLNAIGLYQSG